MRLIQQLIYSTVVLTTLLAAPFLLVNNADAAPYVIAPVLSVGSQNPEVGGLVTLSGSGFTPGMTVLLTLHTKVYVLGSTTVDSGGSFSITARLPAGISGSHTLEATDPAGRVLASQPIQLGPAIPGIAQGGGSGGDASGGNGSGAGSGGLSVTGVAVGGTILVGLVLLVGGAAMLVSGRRRKVNR